jgi:hypothetical protein
MDKKISELNVATALTGTEVLPIVQDGETKKVTAKAISELGGAVSIGQVAFGTAAGVISGDSGLTYNSTTGLFFIKQKDQSFGLRIENPTTATTALNIIAINSGFIRYTTISSHQFLVNSRLSLDLRDNLIDFNPSSIIRFFINNNESMRIVSSGNILINTPTDAGFRLDVNGTARFGATTVRAPGALSTDIAFRVQNSTGTANLFQVKGTGTLNAANLPTSATGLVAGDFWNDAGTLKIV